MTDTATAYCETCGALYWDAVDDDQDHTTDGLPAAVAVRHVKFYPDHAVTVLRESAESATVWEQMDAEYEQRRQELYAAEVEARLERHRTRARILEQQQEQQR
jgi:hypothetical protein